MTRDFRLFWIGETISAFGSSFTTFAIPLLIFKVTGSAVYLGATAALFTVPYILFGLHIGAWTDRLDRRRLMILMDLASAAAIGSIPLAGSLGVLSVWWIFVVVFLSATFAIAFSAAQFGAIPSLVDRSDLVSANGRIQASFAAANVLGPLAAGALLLVLPVEELLAADALTFLASALALQQIRRSFNLKASTRTTGVGGEIIEGLGFVLRNKVLRDIAVMMALVNLVRATTGAQLVLVAKLRYAVTDSEIGLLFTAAGIGVFALSLAAGRLRKHWSFSVVALGALMLSGLLSVGIAIAPVYWLAVLTWGLSSGFANLFNINSGSLRQAIVPNQMLGRVITIAMVLSVWTTPIGALLGGVAIDKTGDVSLVYVVAGLLAFAIPLYFRLFTRLGSVERALPPASLPTTPQPGTSA